MSRDMLGQMLPIKATPMVYVMTECAKEAEKKSLRCPVAETATLSRWATLSQRWARTTRRVTAMPNLRKSLPQRKPWSLISIAFDMPC